jgi:hypothetical protein
MGDGVRWAELVADAPEFAQRVRERFELGVHKTMATVRRDGSPRISGTEMEFSDADVTLGMMGGSVKLADVRRDPRVALHSPSRDPDPEDPSAWAGEAKLAGRLVEVVPEGEVPADSAAFALEITEAVVTRVGSPADHLVIESWHPGRGYRSVRRS